MDRIGIRELRQHASRYIARVRLGETIEVTDRGRLVAVLSPPAQSRSDREQLAAEGTLRLAATSGGRPALPEPVEVDGSTEAVLAELREER